MEYKRKIKILDNIIIFLFIVLLSYSVIMIELMINNPTNTPIYILAWFILSLLVLFLIEFGNWLAFLKRFNLK